MRSEKQKEQFNSNVLPAVKEFSQFSEACKRYAQNRRNNSPVQVEKTPEVLENIYKYIEDQQRAGKPLTHAGFIRCFGLSADTYYNLDRYDHVVEEYLILHNLPADTEEITTDKGTFPLVRWSEIKKRVCDVAIQEQLEENCYTNRGNPAGSIFGLKARYQWNEEGTPQHVVNNLVIADGEQARKALEMLTKP